VKEYVKIINKGPVHRLFLEIIGLGTKRGRPNNGISVGQWKSGFKLATPAALRLGINVVASSTDEIGPYILRFELLPIGLVQKGKVLDDELIRYVYSDGTFKDMTISINAFPEFDKPIGDDDNPAYPVLREYIANARDEDVDYGIETNVTKIEQAPRGFTVVYIEQTREILGMLDVLSPRYFKFFDEIPLLRVPELGAIYPKSEKGKTRFFNHGYLVGCEEGEDFGGTCFDYDVFGKDIVNEMRWIKDKHLFDKRLAKLFCHIEDYAILKAVIDFAVENTFAYENTVFGLVEKEDMSENFKQLCRQVWTDKFGKGAYLKCGKPYIDANAESLGLKLASAGYYVNEFFKKAGIMTTEGALQDRLRQMSIREPDANERARIYNVIRQYLLRINFYRELVQKYPIKIMRDPNAIAAGLANRFEEICIEESRLKEDDLEILLIYLHELRHCRSKLTDADFRKFMMQADHEIRYLLALLKIALDALEKQGIKPSDICEAFTKT